MSATGYSTSLASISTSLPSSGWPMKSAVGLPSDAALTSLRRVEPNATPVGGQHAVRDAVDMGTPGAQRHAERRRRVRPEQSDPIDAGEPGRRLRRHPLQQPIRQSIHPRHRSSHPDHRQLRAGAVADGDRSQARRRQRPRRPVPVLRASLGRGATGGTGHARRLHRSDRRVAGGDRGSADELRGAWLL